MLENSKAFTTAFPGRTSYLFSKVEISKGTKVGEVVSMYPTLALWDTGANGSCISTDVVKALGLKEVRKTFVRTAGGDVVQKVYEVCIHLPNDVSVNVDVTEIPALSGGMEALIGMNIIGLGDFAISNFEGRTQMTFRVPSVANADYT
jgi:gag-polyprotein putative aspartyl protease